MPVALDVAVLAADDEQDEILGVARVETGPRRRRLDVQQAALAELAHLVADLDARPAAMDEVELVLLVVPVLEARRNPGGYTIALTPNAVTPSARRTFRKPKPSPSSSRELNAYPLIACARSPPLPRG